jgi:endonuclease/exonuclease/phosphatase family metal-dependent hydrolase
MPVTLRASFFWVCLLAAGVGISAPWPAGAQDLKFPPTKLSGRVTRPPAEGVGTLVQRRFPATLTVILQNPRNADATVYARVPQSDGTTRLISLKATNGFSTPDDFDLEAKITLPGPGQVQVWIASDELGSWSPRQTIHVGRVATALHPLVFRFRLHSSSDPPEQLIKVLSYNAQFFPPLGDWFEGDRGEDGYRLKQVAERVKDYDIIVLNEVFDDGQREDLIKELRRHWAAAGKTLYACGPTDEDHSLLGINLGRDFDEDGGTIILTHFPIVERHQEVFKDAEGYDDMANKGVLHARLQRSGAYLDVFATHLQAGTSREERAARAKQFAVVRDFMRQHDDSAHPCLFLGDLNVRSDEPEYREMLAVLRQARPWNDVWTYFPATASARGATNSPLAPGSGSRIDYVFYSTGSGRGGNLVPRGVSVLPFLDSRVRSLSDHSGVLAQFRWRLP